MVRPAVLLPLLLLCPFLSASGAEERADYLIAPSAVRLPLYDQFQHRMTDREKRALPKGMAFRILDARALLGDGIIPCLRVEFAGQPFSIERDAQATPAAIARDAGGTVIEQAGVRSDTVVIRQAIELAEEGGRKVRLSPDDRILLLMESKNRCYAMTLDESPRCGWIELRPEDRGRVWVPESARRGRAFSQDVVRARIAPLVERTNRLIAMLGREMPNEKRGGRPSPTFSMSTGGSTIAVTFSDSSGAPGFRGTLRALKARIQAELPGLPIEEDPLRGILTVTGW
jgi:hypothetical protein